VFLNKSRGAGRGETEWQRETMLKALAVLKKWSAIPLVKFALIGVVSVLWLFGLSDQLSDPVQTGKYIAISALMVTLAVV